MQDRDPRISEEEARALWRRAAELQASAERARPPARRTVVPASPDYTLEQVSAAAAGAGIDPDFVRLALAEQMLPDAAEVRRDRWTARWLRRIVGDADVVEIVRAIPAPAARVLAAFQTVAARPNYNLLLESRIGREPLGDAVHVYRLDAAGLTRTPFHSTLDFADIRVLLVRVRERGDHAELHIRAPLFRRGANLVVGGTGAGVLGASGAWAGFSAAGALGAATTLLLAAPAVAGVAAGGALGFAAFRKLYHSIIGSAEVALRAMVRAVELEAENAGAPPRESAGP